MSISKEDQAKMTPLAYLEGKQPEMATDVKKHLLGQNEDGKYFFPGMDFWKTVKSALHSGHYKMTQSDDMYYFGGKIQHGPMKSSFNQPFGTQGGHFTPKMTSMFSGGKKTRRRRHNKKQKKSKMSKKSKKSRKTRKTRKTRRRRH